MSMKRGYLASIKYKTVHFHNPPQEKAVAWFLAGYQKLSLLDKVKLLLGFSLHVCFYSVDGECNAACGLTYDIRKD